MNNTFYSEKIKIGNLTVPRFMAAPLDGVTDSPLRQLIREFCPSELMFGEMRHVAHVANNKQNSALKYDNIEHPIAFQFSANKLDFMDIAIEKVIEAKFDMINLNCGCPSQTVVKSGSGSALMADPKRLKILLDSFYTIIKNRVPLTIKIRSGFKETSAIEIARLAQDSGVSCIMIHPRTQPGGFTSSLDFDLVKKLKEVVEIPIIFSGNINSFARAQKTYDLTGVDGFMVGRALWGAPWKIREIIEHSQGNEFVIDTKTALHYAVKHFSLNLKYYGQHGFNVFKKQLPLYIRSIKDAASWRGKLLTSRSASEMKEKLEQVCLENS